MNMRTDSIERHSVTATCTSVENLIDVFHRCFLRAWLVIQSDLAKGGRSQNQKQHVSLRCMMYDVIYGRPTCDESMTENLPAHVMVML